VLWDLQLAFVRRNKPPTCSCAARLIAKDRLTPRRRRPRSTEGYPSGIVLQAFQGCHRFGQDLIGR
jgi:hypothetical protein